MAQLRVAVAVFLAVAGSVEAFAQSTTADFHVLLDVDRDVATGCAVAGMDGVDVVLTTSVAREAAFANVTRTFRQSCSGGALGAAVELESTGWPAGLEPASGSVLVETRIPFTAFPDGVPQNMRQ